MSNTTKVTSELNKQSSGESNNEQKNTKFFCMYRDASNYKFSEHVIFQGAISAEELSMVLSTLDDGEDILPEQVGLRTAFQQIVDSGFRFPTDDDHPWHELEVTLTDEQPTTDVPLEDVVEKFRAIANGEAWDFVAAEEKMQEYGSIDEDDQEEFEHDEPAF